MQVTLSPPKSIAPSPSFFNVVGHGRGCRSPETPEHSYDMPNLGTGGGDEGAKGARLTDGWLISSALARLFLSETRRQVLRTGQRSQGLHSGFESGVARRGVGESRRE